MIISIKYVYIHKMYEIHNRNIIIIYNFFIIDNCL